MAQILLSFAKIKYGAFHIQICILRWNFPRSPDPPPRVDFKTFSTFCIAINDLLALKQILYDQLGGVGLYWGEIGPSKVRATAEQT